MSYCRLSEDSDVYVFANVKGIAITTAYDKRVRDMVVHVEDPSI